MPGAGKGEDGAERFSGSDDGFGLEELESHFSNSNSTFNVDQESAEQAKMTFAFRTLKAAKNR